MRSQINVFLLFLSYASAQTCLDLSFNDWTLCSRVSKVFNTSSPCTGTCDEAQCCILPPTCYELGNIVGVSTGSAQCGQISAGFVFDPAKATCPPEGCTVSDCCIQPTKCSHVEPMLRYNCYQFFDSNKSCSTCDLQTCCIPPRTCNETVASNYWFCQSAGLFDDPANPKYEMTCAIAGNCSHADCCRPPRTCQEGGRVSSYCAATLQVVNPDKNCTGAQCTSPQFCCQDPTFCYEIRNILGSPVSYCGPGKTWNETWDSCVGSCSPAQCCVPITTCGQAYNINMSVYSLCTGGQVFDTSSLNCTNCTTDCCRAPQTCSEFNLNSNACAAVNKTGAYGNQCNGTCTTDACCRAPNVCWESPLANQQTCQNIGKIFNYSSSCTNCDNSDCCREATSCQELSYAVQPYSYCGSVGIFDWSRTCQGACSSAECCRPRATCGESLEYMTLMSQCTLQQLTFEWSTPCSGASCNAITCCRPPRICGEAGLEGACRSLGKALNSSVPCSGTTCNPTQCCVAITDCSAFLNSQENVCLRNGQVPVASFFPQPCVGACSVSQCCVAPTTCYEANVLSGNRLCLNRGVVKYVNCTGAACTPDFCCQAPSSCFDAAQATSTTWQYSELCLSRGFAENFTFAVSCGGECTSATCCRVPNSCSEFQNIWYTNHPRNGIESPANSICKSDVFDHNAVCPNGMCDEKSCCRPAATCGEANLDLLCPAGTAVTPDLPCSGASCTTALCCAVPTTCEAASQNPLLCFSAGMVPANNMAVCQGACTASQCCRAPLSCQEAQFTMFVCPAGSRVDNWMQTCFGTGCNVQTCCNRSLDCMGEINADPHYCAGYGLINAANSFVPCPGGTCTQAHCCRATPTTCGEAAIKDPTFCGGAVNFFRVCVGTQCTSPAFCCRAAANCGEAIKSLQVYCPAGQIPANQGLPACPAGGCSASTCCKPVATCGDANVANNNMLCSGATPVVKAATACSTGSCTAATCCRAPVDCEETTAANPLFCSGATPFVNVQAGATMCSSGVCTQAQCCRAPLSCADAFTNDGIFCSKIGKVFNFSAATLACTACSTQCCMAEPTFAPTTAAPTTAPPTSLNCPQTVFASLVAACTDGDLTPPYNCTGACRTAAASLITAFSSANVSVARGCLDQALVLVPTRFVTATKNYIVNQITLRTPLCKETINASPSIRYSLPLCIALLMVATFF